MTKADSLATPQLLGFGSSPGVPTKGLKRRNSGGKLNATQDNWLKEFSQFNMNAIQNKVINNATEKKRLSTASDAKPRKSNPAF